jgi:hypothetical protein
VLIQETAADGEIFIVAGWQGGPLVLGKPLRKFWVELGDFARFLDERPLQLLVCELLEVSPGAHFDPLHVELAQLVPLP